MNRNPTTHHLPPTTHLAPLALWTLLWALFFGTILLGWERLPNSDLTGQFDAFARHQAREMLAGRLPLWSAGSFGGIPFVADVQAAVFYLPRWVTIVVSAPWGFSYYALELEALLHIWLMGVFVYFLAYNIAVGQRHAFALQGDVVRCGALVPAVMVGLGGYITSYPLLQLAVLETFTWLPLVLLLIRKGTAETRFTSRFLLFAGLILALAFTAGHPQTFLHISYVAAFYYLFCTWQAGWGWSKILGYGTLIGVVVIGGSAVTWLPVITYLPLTVRADVNYGFVSTGESVLNYLQVVMPGLFTFWSPQFVGVGGGLLAVVAWLNRHRDTETQRHGEIWFWGMGVLLGAWLSLGDKGVLFEGWYYVAPGFQLFRQQERLVGVVVFGVSMLAGLGVMRVDRGLLRRGGMVVGGILVVAAVVALVAPHIVVIDWPLVWGRQVLFLGGALWLLWFVGQRHAFALRVGIVCLIAAELYVGTFAAVNRTAGSPNVIWPEPEWLEVLREEPDLGRVDPGFLFFVNMGEAYDLESVRGITPLKPQVLEDMEGRLILSRLWPLLNVTHGVFVGDAPEDVVATKVADVDESLIPGEPIAAGLYRFEEALPRVWLSTRPVVVADDAAALEAIADPAFDPAVQVVVLEETAALYSVEPADRVGTVVVNRPRDGLLDITVDTPSAAYVVISEWYMVGWKATLNGQAESLHKVNYGLQAVFVPAGSHRLTLEFAPQSVTIGIIMSTFVIFCSVGWLTFNRRSADAV